MTRASSKRKPSPASPVRRLVRLAAWLAAGLCLTALATAGLTVRYMMASLDERLTERPWDLPSPLMPRVAELRTGAPLPPGGLERALTGLGYRKVSQPAQPGEFAWNAGHLRVLAHPGWPGLTRFEPGPVEAHVTDGLIREVRVRGKASAVPVSLPGPPYAELRRSGQESRMPVSLKDVPPALKDAVLAVEDRRFYTHHGVDPRGLVRALLHNVMGGGRAQGGSTLTQQLAKNLFLTQERTYPRKIKEALWAVALEQRLSKEEILGLYLNEIYLGQRGATSVCGVGQAARAFFSKDVSRLTLAESALLAGLIQSPNALAPDRHPQKALNRRNLVLGLMRDQGRITAAAHDQAVKEPIRLTPGLTQERTAPYFVDAVGEELAERFPDLDFTAEGLRVETTLDPRIQRAAEAALLSGLGRADGRTGAQLQGAVVVMAVPDGAVLAMVGGRSYPASQFNRATLARRQPGSVIKPLIMLGAMHAMDTDVGPASLLKDEPLTVLVDGQPWSPRNSDRRFHGPVSMRVALEQSLNVPTVRLVLDAGLHEVAGFLGACGLAVPAQPPPALALGALEVTPLQLAGAYSVVAGGGERVTPHLVDAVRDRDGKTLWQWTPAPRRLVSRAEAFMVRDMMRGVVERGTARNARAWGYQHPLGGKTGTTSEGRDAWFVAVDPDLVAVVWVGSDLPVPTALSGSQSALPILVDLMKAVRGTQPPPADPDPSGVTRATICAETRRRAVPGCPVKEHEVFFAGAAPDDICGRHANLVEQLSDALLNLPRRALQDLFREISD